MAQADATPTVSERPYESVLDSVYDRLSANDPFMPMTGFIDHTTMAAEALVAIGQGGRLEAWAARARVRPLKSKPSGIAIEQRWPEAVGRKEYLADWIAHFERELSERSAPIVLAAWIPRFAHDPGAFLFHGLIRVGHAARAITHRDTPQRRTELAMGLALWAVGVKGQPPDRSVSADGKTSKRPIEFARLAAPAFARHRDIRTLHLVTGPMAGQLVEAFVGEDTAKSFAYGFARTHAHLREGSPTGSDADAPDATFGEARLERLTDVHDIKLVEAVLRAYRLGGDPVFLHAAQAI